MLVETAETYDTAKAGCEKKEATLATIGNEGENSFLTML